MNDHLSATGSMSAADDIAQALAGSEPLRQSLVGSAIEALRLPVGSRGLDAGCGIGLQAVHLAEAVGPSGQVTGLDLSPGLLVHARAIIEDAGLAGWVTFKEGDVASLPFEDNVFDWAWSMDCVGYLPLEPIPLLAELARVVRPGGQVALLAWTSERLLPGYPKLEAHLNATSVGIAPFMVGRNPEQHFTRALSWFGQAGLERAAAQTFVGNAHAPLQGALRRALDDLIQMRWQGAEAELSTADAAEFQRLCRPESPDYILNQPGYYAYFTYSMFSGLVTA